MPVNFKAARTMLLWAMVMLTASLVTMTPLIARSSTGKLQSRAWAMSLIPQLAGTDATARKTALALIAKQLQANPYRTAWLVYWYWLPPLMASGHYRTVAHLALQGILAAPAYTGVIDHLLIFRIQALAAMHKDAAALRNAKSLFNVCTMGDAGIALLILDQRLDVVYHNQPDIVRQFVREERLGSQMPADDNEPIIRSGVVASIQVHASPYLARLKSLSSNKIRELEEKGDLLLLADQPAKALQYFQLMEDDAGNAARMLTYERFICRAIKAQDGTLGRANAYLLQTIKDSGPPK